MATKAQVLILLAVLALCMVGHAQGPAFDLVIAGGVVFDGTGAPGTNADIGIKDGVIAATGPIPSSSGARVISARGLYVAPGFIDIHTRSARPQGCRPGSWASRTGA